MSKFVFGVFGGLVMAFGLLPLATAQASTAVVVTPDYQPDAMVKLSTDDHFVGGNVYNSEGTEEYRSAFGAPGSSLTFVVKIQNDGNVADAFRLHGARGDASVKFKYLKGATGGTDISRAVKDGTYTTGTLAKGAFVTILIQATISPTAPIYSGAVANLHAISTKSSTPKVDKDTVLPIVTAEITPPVTN